MNEAPEMSQTIDSTVRGRDRAAGEATMADWLYPGRTARSAANPDLRGRIDSRRRHRTVPRNSISNEYEYGVRER